MRFTPRTPSTRPALAGAVALALACALGTGSAQAATQTFTFSDGAQGFTVSDGGALTHDFTGHLRIADTTSEDFLLHLPAWALGDWSGALGETLAFDAYNASNEAPDWAEFGQIRISGPAGTVMLDIAPPNNPPADGGWHRFSTTLDAATWGVAPATFAAILAQVTDVSIKAEFHAGVTETIGIDNVTAPVPVPEPGTVWLLGVGLAGVGLLARSRRRG